MLSGNILGQSVIPGSHFISIKWAFLALMFITLDVGEKRKDTFLHPFVCSMICSYCFVFSLSLHFASCPRPGYWSDISSTTRKKSSKIQNYTNRQESKQNLLTKCKSCPEEISGAKQGWPQTKIMIIKSPQQTSAQ